MHRRNTSAVPAVFVRARTAHAHRHPPRHGGPLPRRARTRRRRGPAHLRRVDLRHRGKRRVARRPRHRPRRPHRHPDAVGQLRAVCGDPRDAGRRSGIRAGRRRRPGRTRRAGVRRGRRGGGHHRAGPDPRARLVAGMARRGAAGSRRRLDHLHVRIHRHPEGCRGHASQRRRVRRRGSANVLAGQPHWARRPGAGRTLGRVRRVVRGDVAGLAARRPAWCPRRARWCAAAWTWGRGWCPATSPWCRRCRRWRRCGPPRRSRRCGC